MENKSFVTELMDQLQKRGVRLVAVSKTKPESDIMALYTLGHRDFGENKVQELLSKYESLPRDVRWHMIGHLQRNKVKYITPFVHLIHSVDSHKLLKEINKQAAKHERVQDCLLQLHIAQEETKYGLSEEEAKDILSASSLDALPNVRICGLMGMATFTDKEEIVRGEFRFLKQLFDRFKERYFRHEDSFRIVSMGMSSDYRIAIEEGSNMVRIGTLVFGARN